MEVRYTRESRSVDKGIRPCTSGRPWWWWAAGSGKLELSPVSLPFSANLWARKTRVPMRVGRGHAVLFIPVVCAVFFLCTCCAPPGLVVLVVATSSPMCCQLFATRPCTKRSGFIRAAMMRSYALRWYDLTKQTRPRARDRVFPSYCATAVVRHTTSRRASLAAHHAPAHPAPAVAPLHHPVRALGTEGHPIHSLGGHTAAHPRGQEGGSGWQG